MPKPPMQFHPAANIFPMDDENIEELANDIRKNGQVVPIEMFQGMIIDGRRRSVACRIADVEPETIEVNPADPVAYVLSLNLHRRHLTPSQLSMVAARARDYYDAEAKVRQRASGGNHKGKAVVENLPQPDQSKARDAAGKAVGVSGRSVDFATKVLTQGTPELIAAVESGRMAVSTAAVYASEPPEKQLEVASNPRLNRKYRPGFGGGSEIPEAAVPEHEPGKLRGVGIERAHEAIACLKRIPENDGLRKRGLQVVADWIRHNK